MARDKMLHDTGEPEEPEASLEVDRATVKNDRMQAVSDYADAVLGEDISFQEFAEWKLAKTRNQQPVQARSGGSTIEELMRQQQAIIDSIDATTADPGKQQERQYALGTLSMLAETPRGKIGSTPKRAASQPHEFLDREAMLEKLKRFG